MKAIGNWIVVYRAVAAAILRARLTYRWNFMLDLFLQIVMLLAELLVVVLIVTTVHGLGGWSVYQIVFLFGLSSLSSGLYRVFASEFHSFDKYLVNGEFDAVLTRPAPSLVVLSARSIDFAQAGMIIQGLAIVGYASQELHLWQLDGFSLLWQTAIAWISGGAIWVGIVIIFATLGFWTTRIDDLAPVVLYGPETAANYPLSIYPRAIQAIFYGILPVAFGGYIPARVILHKDLGSVWLVISLGVSILTLAFAILFWQIGVRRYTSTGS